MQARTLVYQSYRTENVSPLIESCLGSVKEWAILKGYEYRFIGDEFLQLPGREYVEKARNNIFFITDYARLLLARDYLQEGYDRVVWMDADVFVFNPERFDCAIPEGFREAFCLENWHSLKGTSDPSGFEQVLSNAIFAFTPDSGMLGMYIDFCRRQIMDHNLAQQPRVCDFMERGLSVLNLGPEYITRWNRIKKTGTLDHVLFSHTDLFVAADRGDEEVLQQFALGPASTAYHAVHLCASSVSKSYTGFTLTEEVMMKYVRLLKGEFGRALSRRATHSLV